MSELFVHSASLHSLLNVNVEGYVAIIPGFSSFATPPSSSIKFQSYFPFPLKLQTRLVGADWNHRCGRPVPARRRAGPEGQKGHRHIRFRHLRRSQQPLERYVVLILIVVFCSSCFLFHLPIVSYLFSLFSSSSVSHSLFSFHLLSSAYFGFGSSTQSKSVAQVRSEGHTFLLYFGATSLVCLTLLGAAFFLIRRFLRERERTLRERINSSGGNSSSGVKGALAAVGQAFGQLVDYFRQEDSTPDNGHGRGGALSSMSQNINNNDSNNGDESDEEAPRPHKASARAQKSHSSTHHDRRRKVLQKFAVKR